MKTMQCQVVQRRISAYLDGELDSAFSKSMERHIGQCEACRTMAADFRSADELVRSLPRFDPGPDFAGQLLEKVGEPASVLGRAGDRPLFAPVMRFISSFMDLLEARKSPSTRTLDEFSDFPPFSLGFIYFRLLDQSGRG
jgi:hypothetical protein